MLERLNFSEGPSEANVCQVLDEKKNKKQQNRLAP